MILDDVKIFIQHNFGSDAVGTVDTVLKNFPNNQIENFSIEDKNHFAGEIMAYFPSLGKDPSLLSRLRIILELEKERTDFKRINIYQRFLHAMSNFWNHIDKTYFKYEIILNIFCNRAVDASLQGMPHEDIKEVVDEAVEGIRDRLHEAYEDLFFETNLKKGKVRKTFSDTPLDMGVKYEKVQLSPRDQFITDLYEGLWNVIEGDFKVIQEKIGNYLDFLRDSKDKTNQQLINEIDGFIRESWDRVNKKHDEVLQKAEKLKEEVEKDAAASDEETA